MRRPGARVAMSWKGPPVFWPGLGSQVSRWLGPPFIHSTMQAFAGPIGFFGAPAAGLPAQAGERRAAR